MNRKIRFAVCFLEFCDDGGRKNRVWRPQFCSVRQQSFMAGGSGLGWQLQMQTNDLAAGLSTNWFVVPNSTTTNSMTVPVNLINGCTFYRLSYP